MFSVDGNWGPWSEWSCTDLTISMSQLMVTGALGANGLVLIK